MERKAEAKGSGREPRLSSIGVWHILQSRGGQWGQWGQRGRGSFKKAHETNGISVVRKRASGSELADRPKPSQEMGIGKVEGGKGGGGRLGAGAVGGGAVGCGTG